MLKIHKEFKQARSIDPKTGNIQPFLERLLIEVISENYRHFLSEAISFYQGDEEPSTRCWPPLLASERKISGVFQNGISRICPISRPEHSIRRPIKEEEDSELIRETPQTKNGNVDYIAYYGRRHIAIELKRGSVGTIKKKYKNTKDQESDQGDIQRKWRKATDQAQDAILHMAGEKSSYDHPISLSIMAIRIAKKIRKSKSLEDELKIATDNFTNSIEAAHQLNPKPQFIASYLAPKEMQISSGWGKESDEHMIFPGLIFIAKAYTYRPRKPQNQS